MPLLEGKKNVGANVHELMQAWHRKGKIGHSKHLSKEKARQMSVAIAMSQARK
jgi:hypothetical protein